MRYSDRHTAECAGIRRQVQTVTTSSGLQYIDLAEGTGRQAEIGDTATVHYTGWLADGTKFDSSLDRKEPFSFRVGSGQVIQGGMKVSVRLK